MLLENGACPNPQTKYGTPLVQYLLAHRSKRGLFDYNLAAIYTLFQYGALLELPPTGGPLLQAAKANDQVLLKLILGFFRAPERLHETTSIGEIENIIATIRRQILSRGSATPEETLRLAELEMD